MTFSAETLEAFQSTLARRMRLLLLLTGAGEAVGVGVIAWIPIGSATKSLYWLLAFVAIASTTGVILMAAVLRQARRRLMDFLAVVAPRGRLIALMGRLGPPFLVLDNDLMVQFQPATTFRLFFSITGDPLSPDLGEARRWRRTLRLRRVGEVTEKEGDPALRAELDQIHSRLASRWARIDVFERARIDEADPRSPTRNAVAAFLLQDPMRRGEAIVREADSIRRILVAAATSSRAGPQ